MKITADTNILLRAVVQDDPPQASAAQSLLSRATVIAVPVPVLCEFAWVLRRTYGRSTGEIATAIEAIVHSHAIATDRPVVESGLQVLRAGGDFADGVIAHEGANLGATVFASFDRRAVARLRESGLAAADPSDLDGDRS